MAMNSMKVMKAMKVTGNEGEGQAGAAPTMKAQNGPKAKIDRALSNSQSEMDMSDGDVEHMRYLLYKEFGLKLPEINIHY